MPSEPGLRTTFLPPPGACVSLLRRVRPSRTLTSWASRHTAASRTRWCSRCSSPSSPHLGCFRRSNRPARAANSFLSSASRCSRTVSWTRCRRTPTASPFSPRSLKPDFGLSGRRLGIPAVTSRANCCRKRWSSSSQPSSWRGLASSDAGELHLPVIILVRHGLPDWDFETPIPGHGVAHWLEGERDAGLVAEQRPGVDLARLVRNARCVIASPLRRSIESARLLAPSVAPLIDEHFTEPALPCDIRSSLRLRPGLWTGLLRSAWFCGWSPGAESFKMTRARAAEAVQILMARAEGQGSVALVGHGLMNILIAGQLRAAGWRGPRFPRPRHWAFGAYVLG